MSSTAGNVYFEKLIRTRKAGHPSGFLGQAALKSYRSLSGDTDDPEAQAAKPARPWLYVQPRSDVVSRIRLWQTQICRAIKEATPVRNLHVTLFHKLLNPERNMQRIQHVAAQVVTCGARIADVEEFATPDGVAVVLLLHSPDLVALRSNLANAIEFEPSLHEYRPHITVAYLPHQEAGGLRGLMIPNISGQELSFDGLHWKHGTRRRFCRFLGEGAGYLSEFEPTRTAEFDKAAQQRSLFADEEIEAATTIDPRPATGRHRPEGPDCGANAQGGGGFQPGNTCARGKGGSTTGSSQPAARPQPVEPYRGPRRRQFHMLETPIVGPSGAKLTSYEWMWHYEMNEEGDEVRRSDWDEAIENELTGRRVVHVFGITDKHGHPIDTSLESALIEMGYMDRRSDGAQQFTVLANALKRQAVLSFQLDQATDPRQRETLERKLQDAQENVKRLEKLATDPNNNPDARRDMLRELHKRLNWFKVDEFGQKVRNASAHLAMPSNLPFTRETITSARREGDAIQMQLAKVLGTSLTGAMDPRKTLLSDEHVSADWQHPQHSVPVATDQQVKRWYTRNAEKVQPLIDRADRWIREWHPIPRIKQSLHNAVVENHRPGKVFRELVDDLGYRPDAASRTLERLRTEMQIEWDDVAQRWIDNRPKQTIDPPDPGPVGKALGMSTTSGETGGVLLRPKAARRKKTNPDPWMEQASRIIKALDSQYGTEEWPSS